MQSTGIRPGYYDPYMHGTFSAARVGKRRSIAGSLVTALLILAAIISDIVMLRSSYQVSTFQLVTLTLDGVLVVTLLFTFLEATRRKLHFVIAILFVARAACNSYSISKRLENRLLAIIMLPFNIVFAFVYTLPLDKKNHLRPIYSTALHN